MKNIILTILIVVALGEVVTIFLIKQGNDSKKVLAEATVTTPTQTPSPSPTVTPTPTPILTPIPTATPKPSSTPVPRPQYSSSEVNSFVERFAAQYGVDPNVMRYIALCESGFNPSAARLSYAGLFQFGPTTWKNLRVLMGEDPNTDLRFNAEEAAQTAAFAISSGDSKIWPNCMP